TWPRGNPSAEGAVMEQAELQRLLHDLESGPLRRFADWPNPRFRAGAAGVYTVWARSVRWPTLRALRAFARAYLPGSRTGTRARRKPRSLIRYDGVYLKRNAAWQPVPTTSKLPPRITRPEPSAVSVHCHTLPCMSHNPSLFDGYAPTRVGRPRYGPCGALPNG